MRNILCIIPVMVMCCLLSYCDVGDGGGSATVTVKNASQYEVTNIELAYRVTNPPPNEDFHKLDSLAPGASHEFYIEWDGYPSSNQNIEYDINGRHFNQENEVGARLDHAGVWYSPVLVEKGCKVTITIYDEKYEIEGGVMQPEPGGVR